MEEKVVKCSSVFGLVFVGIMLRAICGVCWGSSAVDYPEVPRVSAYEAYVKYLAGKAIIIQSDGRKKQRVIGSLNFTSELVRKGKMKMPALPKSGIEIFTFCY
jgi:hypothetical protein